ncbi:hypothetical protein J1N35_009898 [Gossypium stocksii]|uniref:Reverse transcriptase n=1 Tax=Gossypium stocksii TaxID=47602 RepID=A0A9D3W1F0_9ROSI|nr:hypothetical protein J1N35_009898 [Gossypium stocksii]
METKLCATKMEAVRRRCGFLNGIDVSAEGSRGGLSFEWNGNNLVILQSFSKYHIDVEVQEEDSARWRFTGFYGAPELVGGDFNEILFAHEKQVGLLREEARMEAFRSTLEDCLLEDIGFSGTWFTWERGKAMDRNIRERLDREVANDAWLQQFPNYSLRYLPHSISDHCPLLIETEETRRRSPDRFRFEAWWVLEESCEEQIKSLWESSSGSFASRMKFLANGLNVWGKKIRNKKEGRRHVNRIRGLQRQDGVLATDNREMENIAQEYFSDLFTSRGIGDLEHILSGIRLCVSDIMNQNLVAIYKEDEIMEALKSMGPTKASGANGFPAIFYQKFWHIIVLHAFKLKRAGKKGLMALKLDMSKAYDRVEWYFIQRVMLKMGFDVRFVDFIIKCVNSVQYSIILNGEEGSGFKPSRGLRQRDPLSPYLFLFCGEGLSVLMRLACMEKKVKWATVCRNAPPISHLMFADDCILFWKVSTQETNVLKNILEEYESCTGQCINFEKSTVLFSKNVGEHDKNRVVQALNVRCSTDPEKYLGLPNMMGRRKKLAFQNIKDRLKAKINNWSIRHISQGGREVFIKAVLQAIPTYSMACFLLPKSFCVELENIMSSFWWRNNHGKRGLHWCEWKSLCATKEEGGMGFRHLSSFNIAVLAKQGWRLLRYPNSLLARTLKAKYFKNTDFLNSSLGNLPSFTWKSIWEARGFFLKEMGWRIGDGQSVSVWDDAWVPGHEEVRIQNVNNVQSLVRVLDLIDGEYSVRSGHRLLLQDEQNHILTDLKQLYKKLWSMDLTPKIKITVWRLLNNYLPNFSNLHYRRMLNSPICRRCQSEAETMEHIFRDYPTAKETWQQLYLVWSISEESSNFSEWMRSTFESRSKALCRMIACALWAIWMSRNRWAALVDLRLKVNFDAAFNRHTKESCSGIVICNSKAEVICSKTVMNFNISSAFVAEAVACLQALNLGLQLGLKNVEVEGDSHSVIQKLQEKKDDRSEISMYLKDSLALSANFDSCIFLFTNREANKVAHELAQEGLTRRELVYLSDRVLSEAVEAVAEDKR